MGGLEPWHIIVIVAVLFLLFGYRKLPSATKSIAQSMKIFRDETKGLRGEDTAAVAAGEQRAGTNTGAGALAAPGVVAGPVEDRPVAPAPVAVTVPAPPPTVAPVTVAQPAAQGQPASLAPQPQTRSGQRAG